MFSVEETILDFGFANKPYYYYYYYYYIKILRFSILVSMVRFFYTTKFLAVGAQSIRSYSMRVCALFELHIVEAPNVINVPKCNKGPKCNTRLVLTVIKILNVIKFGPKCNNRWA